MFQLILITLLIQTTNSYTNLTQCSNYDFQLINYTDYTETNSYTNINELHKNNELQLQEEHPIKLFFEYYLRLIVENDKLIIARIWLLFSIFLITYGYIFLIKNIDYDELEYM